MAILQAHPGSWTLPGTNIRLPDIGLTESIARAFGQSMNPQGGSQLRQGTIFNVGNIPYSVNQPITTGNVRYTPDTLGGYYQYTQPKGGTTPPKGGTTPPAGGGGGPTGPIMITESEALARGWDINNLPSGYVRYTPVEDREAKVRGYIEQQYNELASTLDEIAGLVPQRQQQEEQILRSNLQLGQQGLEQQKQTSEQNLEIARQQVEQQLGGAKQDIFTTLRDLLQGAQRTAGLAGAGYSSAAQTMIPYALGKQGARSLGQVQSQAMSQFNQIEMKKNDVLNTYNLAKNQLEQDFNNQLLETRQKYADYLDQIRLQKANAGAQKAQALAQLEAGLMQAAQQEAMQLRQAMLGRATAIEEWARNRIAQLDDYKIKMGQMGQYNPQALVYSELQGVPVEMSQSYLTSGDVGALASLLSQRKRLLDQFNK